MICKRCLKAEAVNFELFCEQCMGSIKIQLQDADDMLQKIIDYLPKVEYEEHLKLANLYEIYYEISVAIVEYRKNNSLSQKDLAKKLDTTVAWIKKFESGDYQYTIEQLNNIATALNLKFEIQFKYVPN